MKGEYFEEVGLEVEDDGQLVGVEGVYGFAGDYVESVGRIEKYAYW